ncbi:MAG: hypothetical protein OH318_00280 [Candidatus Parvarchaeota archaeon]|nr:hypothetical protein [Candidatus Rehaiarchaeum fermentans]MCW1293404.1 hypothetical protein [Candidatus Rehaiarchaeum fermentans]
MRIVKNINDFLIGVSLFSLFAILILFLVRIKKDKIKRVGILVFLSYLLTLPFYFIFSYVVILSYFLVAALFFIIRSNFYWSESEKLLLLFSAIFPFLSIVFLPKSFIK